MATSDALPALSDEELRQLLDLTQQSDNQDADGPQVLLRGAAVESLSCSGDDAADLLARDNPCANADGPKETIGDELART
jgi:hypothetical protein